MGAFTSTLLARLGTEAVVALDANQIAEFNSTQIAALTTTQLSASKPATSPSSTRRRSPR